LGESHVYQYPTFKDIYQTKQPFDPEGLLGFLTSCVLTYLGVSAGHIFIHYKKTCTRVVHFLFHFIVYGSFALILCKWSRDDGSFFYTLKIILIDF
jgi:heparan-alpha-glucosaminide N-acetyltransferase